MTAFTDPTTLHKIHADDLAAYCALVANAMDLLQWRENGLGLLQAYLVEGDRELRVHIWSPLLERPGMRRSGNIHDHRFDMLSRVLVGSVHHGWTLVEESPTGNGAWRVGHVVNARKAHADKGTFDCDLDVDEKTYHARSVQRDIPAGWAYRFPRFEFHESYSDELTVTLVEKTNQVSDVRARICWPGELPLTHAFGGEPSGHAPYVLQQAKTALLVGWSDP